MNKALIETIKGLRNNKVTLYEYGKRSILQLKYFFKSVYICTIFSFNESCYS